MNASTLQSMDLRELEELGRAAFECSGLAAKATDLDRKALSEYLAWSHQHLAANLKMWANMAAADRVILDAARACLLDAAADSVAPLYEGPSAISESFLARKGARPRQSTAHLRLRDPRPDPISIGP
jgi:hypothetical protein